MWNDIESQTVEAGELTLKIRHVYDESPDYSYLGEYTDKPDNFVVDRATGILYSEDEAEPEPEDFGLPNEDCWYPILEKDPYYKEWTAYEEAFDEWNERYGLVELAGNLSANHERGTYQYFDVKGNHLPHNKKNWNSVTDEKIAELHARNERKLKAYYINTNDKRYDMDILYTCQDYERMAELEKGYWCYIGIVIEVSLKDTEIGQAGLWGIESDADDHIEEIAKELIDEAIKDAAVTLHDLAALDLAPALEKLRNVAKEELDV